MKRFPLRLTTAIVASMMVAAPALAEDLTIGLASEPTSIDPHYHNLGPNNALSRHIFSRLILQDENQQLTPGLAVSWEAIDDLTWEFKLREGVTFHDGNLLTADDVVFSFERAPDVPNSPSSFATYIKGKTAVKVDDLTVHIKTESPYPQMPNDVSTIPIISVEAGEGAATEDYNSGKAAIGAGAYKFVEYVPGDRIVIERNPDYWGEAPAWDSVTFKAIKSGPSRVAALLAGDVDVIAAVPTTDIESLKGEENVSLYQGVSNRVIYLHLDHDRGDSPFVKAKDGGAIENPLRDQRVRMAISKSINRDAIVERVMENVALKAGQLLPEGFFGVSPNLPAGRV